jgi:hypothetical protein
MNELIIASFQMEPKQALVLFNNDNGKIRQSFITRNRITESKPS